MKAFYSIFQKRFVIIVYEGSIRIPDEDVRRRYDIWYHVQHFASRPKNAVTEFEMGRDPERIQS